MDTREKIITLAEFVRRPERGRWKTVIGVFDPFTLQVARMIRERANDGKLLVVVSPGNGTLLSAEARAALMAGLRGVNAVVVAEAGEARAVLTALGDIEIFEDAEADRRHSKEFVEFVLESAQAAGRGAEQKRNSADVAAARESVVRVFLKRQTSTRRGSATESKTSE